MKKYQDWKIDFGLKYGKDVLTWLKVSIALFIVAFVLKQYDAGPVGAMFIAMIDDYVLAGGFLTMFWVIWAIIKNR